MATFRHEHESAAVRASAPRAPDATKPEACPGAETPVHVQRLEAPPTFLSAPGSAPLALEPTLSWWLRMVVVGVPAALTAWHLTATRDPASAGLFAASFVAVLASVPLVRRWVRRLGAVRLPGGREVRREAIPLLGGLPVFLVFAIVATIDAVRGSRLALGLLAGASLMVVVGLLDDLHRVRPRVKILAQVLAGLALVGTGFRLPALDVPGLFHLELGWLEVPVVLFWVVLVTNALNLADGKDGQATVLALIALAGVAHVGAASLVLFALVGALLGFLPANLPRARIYLGDAGSLFLGFVLAGLLLLVPAQGNLVYMLGLLAYPLGDVAFSVLRRYARGKPLFAPDRSHLHHKVRALVGSDIATLGVVSGLAAVPLLLAFHRPGHLSLMLMALLWAALVVFLVHAGRVRLGRMIGNRRPFQTMHLTKAYVEGRIRLAASPADVRFALRRLVEDLGLCWARLPALEVRDGQHGALGLVEESIVLADGVATFGYVGDAEEEPALQVERRTVVADALRSAQRRLHQLEEGGARA